MSKKKSYSNFTASDLYDLGLQIIVTPLSEIAPPPVIQPSAWLLETIARNSQLPLATEKAKSELIITPILGEVRYSNQEIFAFYSGFNFEVDSSKGLQGFCDFLLAKMPMSISPQTPIIAVVEAKHQQDLVDAVPQCAAEMYAARLWNEKRNANISLIYGVVTSGHDWLFLKLADNTISVDSQRYYLNNLNELLGVWQKVIDFYR